VQIYNTFVLTPDKEEHQSQTSSRAETDVHAVELIFLARNAALVINPKTYGLSKVQCNRALCNSNTAKLYSHRDFYSGLRVPQNLG
jgi:hypothetical protein